MSDDKSDNVSTAAWRARYKTWEKINLNDNHNDLRLYHAFIEVEHTRLPHEFNAYLGKYIRRYHKQ